MARKKTGIARRWGAAFAATAVIATSLVSTVTEAAPAVAAPFACDASSIYTVNSAGSIRTVDVSLPGGLGAEHASGQRANALGISVDGRYSFTLDNSAGSSGNNKQLAIYDGDTGLTETKPLGDPDVPGVIIRGAVSPTTGVYYYSGSDESSYLGAYNPATGVANQVGWLDTGVSGNGDMAFGANGELYVLVDREIFVVQPGDLPATPGTGNVPNTHVAELPEGTAGNGIAFGADGKLFISQGSTISEVDLATGALTRTISTGSFSNTDLASCSFPNTLMLQKNVIDRYEAADQFTLTVDGAEIEAVSTTTSGGADGFQTQVVGPLFVDADETYSIAEAGAVGADLAHYDSTVSCEDSSGSPVATTGAAPSWELVFPHKPTGENVVCTIANDAKAHPAPGLDLRKTSDPGAGAPVASGDTITYTVEAENTGNTVLDPVVIADDLSGVLDLADYQGDIATAIDGTPVASGAATITGDDLAWTGILNAGQTVTITYSVVVNEDVAGETIANRVTASGTPPGLPPVDPPAVTTEHPIAGFEIAKTASPATGTVVEPGDTISYTVTGTNTGATALDPASITDDLTEVIAYANYNGDVAASTGTATVTGNELTWSGSLSAGAQVTITYSVTVNADASGAVLNNVANGAATPIVPNPENPTGPPIPGEPIVPPTVETEHPVVGSGFIITKNANPVSGAAVNAGDTITYTVTGTNTGDTVLDPASIADDLTGVLENAAYNDDVAATRGAAVVTGDALSWTGSLNPGQNVTITYSVTVDADASGVLIHNVASGTATPLIPTDPSDPESPTTPGTPIVPPTAETEHPVVNPGLTLEKSASPASGTAVNAGDTISYTVTGTNTGDTVLDPASIADDLSRVLSSAAYNGDVAATRGAAVVTGDALTWTGALNPGQNVTITYSVTVNEDATGVLIKNVATGAGTPLVPTDPSDPESPTTPGEPIEPPAVETEHPVVNPGFEIAKSAAPVSGTAVDPGSVVTYTVTGTNTGDTVLDPASIADNLADVLANAEYNDDVAATTGSVQVTGDTLNWNGALAAGQSVAITYSVTVNADAGGETLRNAATGTATPQLPEDPSDPESPTTPGESIVPPRVTTEHPINTPGFALSKSVDPDSGTAVDPGATLTYTVTGVNTGETALDSVDITDDLSDVLAYAEYNDDGAASINGAAAANAPTITGTELAWNGTLAVGETVSVTYSVTVGADAVGQNLVNVVSAEVTPPGGEKITPPPVETDNPVNMPGFSVSKSAAPATGTAVDPGSVITYTVTGVNTGETTLDPVALVDDLSGVLAHAAYNGDAVASINGEPTSAPTVADEALTWAGALAVGEAVTVTYSVTVNADAGGETIENSVTGQATPPGGVPPIETPPATTTHPVNEPGFEIAKTADPATGIAVDAGSVVTYTVTGMNTGETVLDPVSIADDLSGVLAHAVYNGDVAASAGEATVDGTDLDWTGALAIGERVTITYSVTVNGDAGGTVLKNTVTGAATPPGGETVTPPPSTTEHPVNQPGFEFTKTADPKSGSTIATGSTVTYTLTGTNTGETALDEVVVSDDLSRVLAHAKYQSDAVAKIGGEKVAAPVLNGDRLSWNGALEVGEQVTITYSVKVNDDAAGAKLVNVAVATATPPGGEPIEAERSTTEHTVSTPLAVTGAAFAPWLAGLGLAGVGALLLLVTRRRRQHA